MCLPPVPILSPYQLINAGIRHQIVFCNMICFYGEEFFAPHPKPNLEYHPLFAVRECLFNIFAATLRIWGRSSIRNLWTSHAVVSGTHKSWLYCMVWWIYCNKSFRTCIVNMYIKYYCLLSCWYISILGSSGKVTFHASHLPLQILCFKFIIIVSRVKRYV